MLKDELAQKLISEENEDHIIDIIIDFLRKYNYNKISVQALFEIVEVGIIKGISNHKELFYKLKLKDKKAYLAVLRY
jgi:hypothetical protein